MAKTFRELAAEWDLFASGVLKKATAEVKRATEPFIDHEPYLETVEFPAKGGVVRQSDLLTAIHLMGARVALHTLPELWKRSIKELISDKAAAYLREKALAQLASVIPYPALVVGVLGVATTVIVKSAVEEVIERKIRFDCLSIRHRFNEDQPLAQKKRKRRVADVRTRNPTKPKRRFKKWASA